MSISTQITKRRKLVTILIHTVAGILVFYFVLHPLAMAVNVGNVVTDSMGDRIIFQLKHAFSFHMLPMAYVFIVAGAIIGLLSGFFWIGMARKKQTTSEQTAPFSDNVEELIASGESHFVEFKSSMRYDFRQKSANRALEEVIAKTIAGFMNAGGGNLLIGVGDNGEVIGLEKDFITLRQKNEDGFECRIFDLISTSMGTEFCHLCSTSFHKLDGKTICNVQIESSAEPVYLNENNSTSFYVRAGNATRQLSVKETVKYLKMKEPRRTVNKVA